MTDNHREVTITRPEAGRYVATNARGSRIEFGSGAAGVDEFTPVELLLAAIAGCTGIDVDLITSRRAEPDSFEIVAAAEKIRDEQGNRLTDIELTFRLTFPDGEAGDAARAVLPEAVKRSHDRLCTVGRTVEVASPVATRIE